MNINFEEIIKTVAEKTDLTLDQARKAVVTVMDELKTKLPANLSGQFESFYKEGVAELKETIVEKNPLKELKEAVLPKDSPLAGVKR